MNKRGVFFFIVDVVIGVLIFLTTILVISTFFIPQHSLSGISQNLDMVANDFFSLSVTSLQSNLTSDLPKEYIQDSVSVDELLYLLAINGSYSSNISSIIESVIDWLPNQFGFKYYIDQKNTLLYSRTTNSGLTESNSKVKLSKSKITIIDSSYGLAYPAVSEVTIWR
jgi:hypothetical protein